MNLVVESKVIKNGRVIIENIPYPDGDEIEIIFWKKPKEKKYPLRGERFELLKPFDSVSENDWEVNNSKIINYNHVKKAK